MMTQKEDDDPNLGVLIDQSAQQIYWDRTDDKKIQSLTLIFEDHILMILPDTDKLKIKLLKVNK